LTSAGPTNAPEARIESRTDALLGATGARLGCAGVALLTAGGSVRRLWARSDSARGFATAQIDALRGVLVERVIDQRSRLLSNRVRLSRDAPVIGRILAVPVSAQGQRPVGIVVAVDRSSGPEFQARALRALRRLSESLAQQMLRDRDAATGLTNWSGFVRRVQRIVVGLPPDAPVSLLYGNIDRLHVLNMARGLAAGDEAILHAAQVIRNSLTGVRNVACRLSGDRFVIALPQRDAAQARATAELMRLRFQNDIRRMFGPAAPLSISWGVLTTPTAHFDAQRAILDAEIACRAAKDHGRRGVEAFESSDPSLARRHDDIDTLRRLLEAIEAKRIVVYAQPTVPLLNSALPTSYELLARIETAEGELVEPAGFLPAAERYQLLAELDRSVISRAFEQLRAAVPGDGPLPFSFSVNLSEATLAAPGFDSWLLEQLQRWTIPARQLTIELRESAAATHLETLRAIVDRLSREGLQFAVDDFGTGLNSLPHLKALNVTSIKLDRSYVHDLLSDTRSQALVRAIVSLADAMGILTVAEYVDTIALRRKLGELGVQFAQGHAVGRAEPLDSVLGELVPTLAPTQAAAG
jgi:diguanylate cyclase (GGDEF)-like protein